jgi:hypothetical protein
MPEIIFTDGEQVVVEQGEHTEVIESLIPGPKGNDGSPGPNLITFTTATSGIPAGFLLRASPDGQNTVSAIDPSSFAAETHTHTFTADQISDASAPAISRWAAHRGRCSSTARGACWRGRLSR